jgi:hypothetical protein
MSTTFRVSVLLGCVLLLACAKAGGSQPNGQADAPASGDDDAAIDIDAANVLPDANTCATQPCDILTQCGCGAMACDIDGTDLMGTACRAIVTPGHETSSCSTASRCDKGFVCAGSTCKKYCGTNADCGSPRGQCVIDITDGTNPIPGIPSVCSSNCDPTNVAAGGCPAGDKCGLFTATHAGVTHNIADCSIAGAGIQGTNCKVGAVGDDTLCGPDFSCTTINAGTNFNCRRQCNKTAGGGCGALTCIGFNPAFTIGAVEYGVCN